MSALAGSVAVVTGAGRGLGREHALLLGRLGAKVVVNDLGEPSGSGWSVSDAAQEVADEIVEAGGEAVADGSSVSDFGAAKQLISTAVETFGDLNIVVNNAGFLRDRMLVSMEEADFDSIIDVHLKGTFNISRWAAAYWREQGMPDRATAHRAIINTTSGSGLHGSIGQTNYAAAKAGIAALTVTHAVELARYGVQVNAIAPIARTRLTESVPGVEEMMKSWLFDASNVSPLVAYLASPGCRFNGEIFSSYGPVVGLYQAWTVAEEVSSAEPWTLSSLSEALEGLPVHVETRHQMAGISEQLSP